MRSLIITLIAILGLTLAGCGGTSQARGPYQPGAVERDVALAAAKYEEAKPLRQSDPEQAEALLREALTADLYHGPSHNDLGVILLGQSKLYEAATEFEWARKLMPGHPDPRVNLAITLEKGFKHQQALAAAQAALEVRPGHLAAHQAIAVIQCRNNLMDAGTGEHLAAIIERSNDERWRGWAETWALKLDGRFR